MVALTPVEVRAVIRSIDPELTRFVKRYQEGKYPPGELANLRRTFKNPSHVTAADIEAALKWKYGRTGKNYPKRQRELAARLGELWKTDPIVPGQSAELTFDRWRSQLGSTSFITVCFLLHLANPRELPILDQHNFRSVNNHLLRVRPGATIKAKPSRFADLVLVRDFARAVRRHWVQYSKTAKPSADALDRYLMMHGKSLKARRVRRTV